MSSYAVTCVEVIADAESHIVLSTLFAHSCNNLPACVFTLLSSCCRHTIPCVLLSLRSTNASHCTWAFACQCIFCARLYRVNTVILLLHDLHKQVRLPWRFNLSGTNAHLPKLHATKVTIILSGFCVFLFIHLCIGQNVCDYVVTGTSYRTWCLLSADVYPPLPHMLFLHLIVRKSTIETAQSFSAAGWTLHFHVRG